MVIFELIKNNLEKELKKAASIWIASALISKNGWSFIQENISLSVIQHFLIGIDLATDPGVFESIFKNPRINARVYETKYTFHPKLYLIQRTDYSYTAFVGSSNTTAGGLEKNVEINFQVSDQLECKKILAWFNRFYSEGYLVSREFIDEYTTKFAKASVKAIEIDKVMATIKASLADDAGQYFSKNDHEIFHKRFHRIENKELKSIRKGVKEKFLVLHKKLLPNFSTSGLSDIYPHHQPRELVSRHYFNSYSGNYVSSMWMHFGKSLPQLQLYKNKDAKSFINNIRMQVIIHEHDLGIWLVLGKDHGSIDDRNYFVNEMKNPVKLNRFFNALKRLGSEYWIGNTGETSVATLKNTGDLSKILNTVTNMRDYFIIGCDINRLDKRLSTQNIEKTILTEFKKLYPLYIMMRHI